VALVLLIGGAVCLAIAVFRARVLPLWVGVAVLASLVCAFLLHGGPVAFVSDYCLFAALFWIGRRAARPRAH
jgi:membrane protein implicated in regulation of membrane protease activity